MLWQACANRYCFVCSRVMVSIADARGFEGPSPMRSNSWNISLHAASVSYICFPLDRGPAGRGILITGCCLQMKDRDVWGAPWSTGTGRWSCTSAFLPLQVVQARLADCTRPQRAHTEMLEALGIPERHPQAVNKDPMLDLSRSICMREINHSPCQRILLIHPTST